MGLSTIFEISCCFRKICIRITEFPLYMRCTTVKPLWSCTIKFHKSKGCIFMACSTMQDKRYIQYNIPNAVWRRAILNHLSHQTDNTKTELSNQFPWTGTFYNLSDLLPWLSVELSLYLHHRGILYWGFLKQLVLGHCGSQLHAESFLLP